MVINSGFYLTGFTRIDKGEEGAVFVRYDVAQSSKCKPEINEIFSNYGGTGTASYSLSIPVPKVVACAIVTRTSKNCYSATVFGMRKIDTYKSDSLDGLRRTVAAFFNDENKTVPKKCLSG